MSLAPTDPASVERVIDHYQPQPASIAPADPASVERVIDHHQPQPASIAPADPASVERVIDHYQPQPASIAPADPASVERVADRRDFRVPNRFVHRHRAGGATRIHADPRVVPNRLSTGTGPVEQCELLSHGTKTASNRITLSITSTWAGAAELQLDLFGDYKSTVALYPTFQQYFRTCNPPLLAAWGKNDPFFLPQGAETFKRNIPDAVVRFFDTGHFALETHAAEIAAAIRGFLPR